MKLSLERIKFNKDTGEESLHPLTINTEDIYSIYKDKKGVYLVTKQGIMHKVPYTQKMMEEYILGHEG